MQTIALTSWFKFFATTRKKPGNVALCLHRENCIFIFIASNSDMISYHNHFILWNVWDNSAFCNNHSFKFSISHQHVPSISTRHQTIPALRCRHFLRYSFHTFLKNLSQLPCIIFSMSCSKYPRLRNKTGNFWRSAMVSRS